MKRVVVLAFETLILVMTVGTLSYAQMTATIPFKFEAGGKSFPPGDYTISQEGDKPVILRAQPQGADVSVPIIKKLPQPKATNHDPELVFDMVGDFEPSYTEYVTDYLLAEVWLPGHDGFLVLTGNRAPQHQAIKIEKAKP